MEFDEQSRLDFKDVFIVNKNESKVSIFFHKGVSLEISAVEDFLSCQISVPTRFKGVSWCITLNFEFLV